MSDPADNQPDNQPDSQPDNQAAGPRRIAQILSRADIAELTRIRDMRGLWSLISTWLIIAGAFALVAWRPNVATVAIALVVLAGRQLALAVLLHEAAHRCLFRSRWLNDFAGSWLSGAFVWTHLSDYRRHHHAHHVHTGTERDTDLGLIAPFPITRASLWRKLARDLVGITAVKRVLGLLLIDLGYYTYTASTGARRIDQTGRTALSVAATGARRLGPTLVTNALLVLALHALGHGWLYWLWVVAYLTVFSAIIRVRAIAEHACTESGTDGFTNTRTTKAGFLARMTVAPLYVNYHIEHHLLMTVPHYNLPTMHRMLDERDVLSGSQVAAGYLDVLRVASAAPNVL